MELNHPNRPYKVKNKKGSSCQMCKPHKTGGATANDIHTIAEIEAISEVEEKVKFPSKAKPKPRKAWWVKKYSTLSYYKDKALEYKYRNEKDARKSYDNAVEKLKNKNNCTGFIVRVELVDSEDRIVEVFENEEKNSGK